MSLLLLINALTGLAVVGGISSIPFLVASSNSYKSWKDRSNFYLSSNFSSCHELEKYVSTIERRKDQKLYLCLKREFNSYKPELVYFLEDRTSFESKKSVEKVNSFQLNLQGNLTTKLLIVLDSGVIAWEQMPTWVQNEGHSFDGNPELVPENDCTLKPKEDVSSNNFYSFSCKNPWKISQKLEMINFQK